MRSDAIRRTQTHSDSIRRTQTRPDAIRRTQTRSDAIRRNQTQSDAIRRKKTSAMDPSKRAAGTKYPGNDGLHPARGAMRRFGAPARTRA
jgi:hypothetical protein